ncbi:hypothetical protein CLOM_g18299 [Closterium sp. NIES-68]|nr:hypothetical protein CLOM_g18299 [Closterium sp. NIES-68]
MVADPAEETSKDDRGMGNEERNAGQFYHVCDKDDSGTAVARAGEELHPLDMWVMDSGAAWTMTPRKDLLDAVRAPPISEVRSASGHAVKVAGVGRAAFRAPDGGLVVLKDILLVPGLKANLISLRKLGQAGVSTTTNGSKTFKGLRGDRVLWDLHESRDVFRSMWQIPALIWESTKKELGEVKAGSGVQGECNAVSAAGVTVSARSGETDWETAHRRLGHVAMPLLQQLHKEEAVKGLKLSGQPNDTKCETCLLSKFTRFPFHGVAGKSKAALELVHMDLVGPFPVRGSKGERYFLTIVDDWSRLMWAYPLKQKDHAASTIRDDWLPFIERQSGHPCKSIRTDRGGEFLGGDLTAWLKKQGIEHQLTTSYTPQSNGVAERANRTILETARALLIESGLGNSMWPHAVRHATVARNRVLTKVADDMWVPLERWLGKKPPVDMLRVFGCMAVAHVPKPYRTKLGASALWCKHLGLAAESKGWLLWEPSKNVLFDSRDVKFVENIMYGKWEKQPEARVTQQLEEITMHFDLSEPADSEVTAPTASGTDEGSNEDIAADAEVNDPEQQQQEASKTPSLPKRRKQIGGGTKDWVKVKEWVNPTIYPARTRMATRKLLSSTSGGATTEQQEQAQGEDAVLFLGDDQESDDEEPAYCFYAPIQPPSMDHALAGPQRGKWLVSRDAEYNSQMENHTWDLVYLPNGKKAIQCKWLAKIKTDEKGEPSVYKSRLVAKGFQQKEKEDYKEVFAPTAKSPTLRVLLAVAAVRKWKVKQMDIVTAFLYGIVEEEVYMVQPPGYEDGTGRVCKLNKAIYGLKQAPRCWYNRLASALEGIGFRASACDESLFLMGEGESLVLLLVYVDDILLFSSSDKEIDGVQRKLTEQFKCKSLGQARYYLGMHIERDTERGWLKLHQGQYINTLAEKYSLQEEREVVTPLPSEFKLIKAAEGEGVESEDQRQFQSMVGSLLYAAVHTRPDISFAVGQLARVVQNPTEEQCGAAERVVRYLKSYPTVGVQYLASAQLSQKGIEVVKEKGEQLGEGKVFLSCFADATWASEHEDSSSVGGYICMVGGGPVSWRSKKQSETALSSVESEYMAMFHAAKEIIWLRRLLKEIGHEQTCATPLFSDSKGAIAMARNAVLHGLNKHMRIKWHWLRKEVKLGTLDPIYVKTQQQPADFLTKRLAEEPHWRCARMAGMSLN